VSAPRQAKPRSSPRSARDRFMPRAPPGRPWWGEARVPAPEDPRSGRWRTSGRDEDVGRGAFAGPVPGRQPVRPPDETPRRWSRSASNSTERSPNSKPSSPATSARPRRSCCPGRRRTPTVALGLRRRPRWLDLAAIPAEIVAPSGWRTTPAHRRLDRPRDPIDLGSDITVRRNDRVRGDGYTVVWAYSLVRAYTVVWGLFPGTGAVAGKTVPASSRQGGQAGAARSTRAGCRMSRRSNGRRTIGTGPYRAWHQ
jgi:hypothetical protein